VPQTTGHVDTRLRDEVLNLTSSNALSTLPGATAVIQAWQARAAALAAYRRCLNGDALRAARSLLHQHHVRVLGADPIAEALTLRLARTAALRRQRTPR